MRLFRFCAVLSLVFALGCQTVPKSSTPPPPEPLDQLRKQLHELFNDPKFDNAFWGVKIVFAETGEVIYEQNPQKGLMPASNMKIFTTAAGLSILGPDYTYKTPLYYSGTIDAEGTLHGDVIVIGSGDPSISGRYRNRQYGLEDKPTSAILADWAAALKARGVKRITGDVIGDDDAFDDEDLGLNWELDDLPFWYAAGVSGLSLNENCYDYVIEPGARVGDPARIRIIPDTTYVTLKNDAVTTISGVAPTADVFRWPNSNEITFYGYIPLGRTVRHRASVWNGTLYTVTVLKETLERDDIAVDGEARDADSMPDKAARLNPTEGRTLFYTQESVPLSRIVSIINKPSQNFYADMLLKTLSKEVNGVGTWRGGFAVAQKFLASIGAPNANLFNMDDGSGLSRRNLVHPNHTVAVLRYMMSSPNFKIFYDSLPIMGVDGTIANLNRGTLAAGNVHAKTGTITYARSLSGYLDTADGERIIFSTMCNNYTTPTREVNKVQEVFTLLLANFKRNPM